RLLNLHRRDASQGRFACFSAAPFSSTSVLTLCNRFRLKEKNCVFSNSLYLLKFQRCPSVKKFRQWRRYSAFSTLKSQNFKGGQNFPVRPVAESAVRNPISKRPFLSSFPLLIACFWLVKHTIGSIP